MLRQVAEGVLIHQSEFCQSNTVVVPGQAGVLLIDAGVYASRDGLPGERPVRCGSDRCSGLLDASSLGSRALARHAFGSAPRYGTARCAAAIRDQLSGPHWKDSIAGWIPPDIVEQISWDLLASLPACPPKLRGFPGMALKSGLSSIRRMPRGHAALLIEERGVLVAGDMLSDVLIPMLDLDDTADPIEDYLAALRLIEGVAGDVDVLVPGHGSIGGADQVHPRIDQDRAYVHALRDAHVPSDPRIGPSAAHGWEWVGSVHERQLQGLARHRMVLPASTVRAAPVT